MIRDFIEFQDRAVAKAFLITFRCYGTWLHGDERGSVDRRYYNRLGTPKITPNAENSRRKAKLMKHNPFIGGAGGRKIVETLSLFQMCPATV